MGVAGAGGEAAGGTEGCDVGAEVRTAARKATMQSVHAANKVAAAIFDPM